MVGRQTADAAQNITLRNQRKISRTVNDTKFCLFHHKTSHFMSRKSINSSKRLFGEPYFVSLV